MPPHACSARKRTLLPTSSSNVSPRMGLNGFQVRSLPPNGPMQNAVTHANLRTPRHADQQQRQILELITLGGTNSRSCEHT